MLSKIIETKKQELNSLVMPEIQAAFSRKSLYQAIIQAKRRIGLIAEVKKASPSKGILREDFHPLEIAAEYEKAGADAVSVLTDQTFFHGSKDYLTEIKRNINIPVLRKDFIIDRKQIEESERIGADAILLIGEVLSPNQLHEFYIEAYERGIECLVEVHSVNTLEKILKIFTPKTIGVNNRNLHTFHTSVEQTVQLASLIPEESIFVSESGIHTASDIEIVKKAGADAVLVGEALMKSQDPKIVMDQLLGKEMVR
jgi:indole-3-glycerol phosphate synthase